LQACGNSAEDSFEEEVTFATLLKAMERFTEGEVAGLWSLATISCPSTNTIKPYQVECGVVVYH